MFPKLMIMSAEHLEFKIQSCEASVLASLKTLSLKGALKYVLKRDTINTGPEDPRNEDSGPNDCMGPN